MSTVLLCALPHMKCDQYTVTTHPRYLLLLRHPHHVYSYDALIPCLHLASLSILLQAVTVFRFPQPILELH